MHATYNACIAQFACLLIVHSGMVQQQGKHWCFTLNNYTPEEVELVNSSVENGNCVYLCYGFETGEENTPHIQGYFSLPKKKRLSSLKKVAGFSRAHLEIRRGTVDEAIAYCEKDGDFHEFGTRPRGQGNRSDLQAIQKQIDEGASEVEIADNHFGQWCVHRNSFKAYRDLKASRAVRDVEVYCLWGEPGTGKTRFVYESFPDVFIVDDTSLKWFDGYQGESTVLIDDYRGEGSGALMLRLLDRYPLRVPIKGGFVQWKPTTIFITSNLPPPFGHDSIRAPLLRRIKKTVYLDTPVEFDNGGYQELHDSVFE